MHPSEAYEIKMEEDQQKKGLLKSFIAGQPKDPEPYERYLQDFAKELKPEIFYPSPRKIMQIFDVDTQFSTESAIIVYQNEIELIYGNLEYLSASMHICDDNIQPSAYNYSMRKYLDMDKARKLPVATKYTAMARLEKKEKFLTAVTDIDTVEECTGYRSVHLSNQVTFPIATEMRTVKTILKRSYQAGYVVYIELGTESYLHGKEPIEKVLRIPTGPHNKDILEELNKFGWLKEMHTFSNQVKQYEAGEILRKLAVKGRFEGAEFLNALSVAGKTKNGQLKLPAATLESIADIIQKNSLQKMGYEEPEEADC